MKFCRKVRAAGVSRSEIGLYPSGHTPPVLYMDWYMGVIMDSTAIQMVPKTPKKISSASDILVSPAARNPSAPPETIVVNQAPAVIPPSAACIFCIFVFIAV